METKNSSIKVNSIELEQIAYKVDNINKEMEDIFNSVDKIMNNINNNDIWQGDASLEYHNRYLELKKYFPKVVNGIGIYSNFLKSTAQNYEKEENQINTNIELNTNNLDIN